MPESGLKPIRRAIISVFDKKGLTELVTTLHNHGVQIVSTGSTAAAISTAGIPVTEVQQITEYPEILDGRVKTLHPRIHGGILADRDNSDHRETLTKLNIEPFDLVVGNLYPFAQTIADGGNEQQIIEKIDIGGPTLLRAAAKNFHSVAVIISPDQYPKVGESLAAGGFTLAERQSLAAAAFQHTADYDVAIAGWFNRHQDLPNWVGETLNKGADLRYGENPHQKAALYVSADYSHRGGLAGAHVLHGKPMSFNNYADADAAWRAVHDFSQPAVAIIKHANPCGIAVAENIVTAHRKAHACDPVSAYGSVVALNREATEEFAEQISPIFTEVILAPSFSQQALAVLKHKKNLRLVHIDNYQPQRYERKTIDGGVLFQERDRFQAQGDNPSEWQLKSGPAADEATLADLVFAWKAIRSVKSNAILLAKDQASVGIGMGQVNRVDSAFLAVRRAEGRAAGSVAVSDAFFPFADGLEILLDAGIKAVVQPGGSIRDEETIAAAQKVNVTMYFTGTRHFTH